MLQRLFPGNDLFKNISTLVVGIFIAQLVPLLLQALLRRLYPAQDFGNFDVFLSLTGILMVAASLRYEMAVVLPERRSDAANLVFAGITLAFLLNLVLLIALFFFHNTFARWLNLDPKYAYLLYFVPAAVFLFGCYQVMNYYLVRYKDFRAVSANKIYRRIVEGFFHVLLGFAGKLSSGLIWGSIIGHVVNVAAGWRQMLRNGFSLRFYSLKRQWELMKEYRKFPLYNMVPAFLNMLCLHFPLILVNIYYGQEITAYFGLAKQVLILPASILTLSISQVLLQNIAEKSRKGISIKKDITRIALMLTLIAIAMTAVISLWAPPLFSIYAGQEYYTSGVYARILVAGVALKLIAAPLSSIFIALKKIKSFSLWQAVYFLLICSLFLFPGIDITTFLIILLFIEITAYGALLIMIFRLQYTYEQNLREKTTA